MFMFGGIAQLGERLTGSQEVSGSIPLISTKRKGHPKGCPFSFNGDAVNRPALQSNARFATKRRKARSTTEGSIPLISTKRKGHPKGCPFSFVFSNVARGNGETT